MCVEKFWLGVWSIVTVFLLGFTFILASHSLKQDELITAAINNGADPIGLRCALSDSLGDNPTCVAYTLNKD